MLALRDELSCVLTDRDVYWKTQRVIKSNARLMEMRSAFFDLFNDSYVYSTAMALRRICERSSDVTSLMNVLDGIKQCPGLSSGVDLEELARDIDALEEISRSVKDYVDKYIAHHDRKRKPTDLTLADVEAWMTTVQETFRRYYAAVMGSDTDPIVAYLEDPMRIFTFAWIQEDPQKD